MDPTIDIHGVIYTLVDRKRPDNSSDSAIYTNHDTYVRIGPPATIKENIRIHRKLEKAGFPVPEITQEGTLGDREYFIERSLGEKMFRVRFSEEVASSGEISAATFEQFLHMIERYLRAQAAAVVEADRSAFVDGIRIEVLCAELPEYAAAIRSKFDDVIRRIEAFPYVLSHGDLSPNNMYPEGVIDLEDAFPAPFGFDAISALTTSEWFPEAGDFEFPLTPYRFSAAQRSAYLAVCDSVSLSHGFPALSERLDDFDFCRGIWLTEGMRQWPKAQRWKYDHFISKYLKTHGGSR